MIDRLGTLRTVGWQVVCDVVSVFLSSRTLFLEWLAPEGGTETTVAVYQATPRDMPEERGSDRIVAGGRNLALKLIC